MIEEQLINETNKWLEKIEGIVNNIEWFDSKGQEMYNNMKAYIADSKHFLEQKDYVRAFEAVVWAWSILELCLDLGVFASDKDIL